MSDPEGQAADDGDEFALIARLFAPLATHSAARGLKDDAALWDLVGPTVITCDAVVEGVHFLPDDPLATVAQKAVRVNMSDLAAKGAKAEGLLLSLIWPSTRPATQIRALAEGLAEDLSFYGCALLGGDMTSTPGPLTISVTAFGRPLGLRAPARADAHPGQDLWVTGTIGDAALGLQVLMGARHASADDARFLTQRYRRPQPRVAFAAAVSNLAAAAMDVSDGLIADAKKMAAASGVRLVLQAPAVPLSDAARRLAGEEIAPLLGGGDDYEILFSADPSNRAALRAAAQAADLRLSLIGAVEQGDGLVCLLPDGRDLGLETGGFVHRIGGRR